MKAPNRKRDITLTVEKAEVAIREAKGILSQAALKVDVSRATLNKFILDHPELKATIEDSREDFVDTAEKALLDKIKQGDTTAIIFALKTQGRRRGYSERSTVDINLGDLTKLSDDELRAILES